MRHLTKNEQTVWDLSQQNMTDSSIAKQINTTKSSVTSSRKRAQRKLGILGPTQQSAPLTANQKKILKLIVRGESYSAIQSKVGVAVSTVYKTRDILEAKGLIDSNNNGLLGNTPTVKPTITEPVSTAIGQNTEDWGSIDNSFKFKKQNKKATKPTNIGAKAGIPSKSFKKSNNGLSVRETQVHTLSTKGSANSEIAQKLGIKLNNVHNVQHNIRKKLGVKTNSKAKVKSDTSLTGEVDTLVTVKGAVKGYAYLYKRYTVVNGDKITNMVQFSSLNYLTKCSSHVMEQYFQNNTLPFDIEGIKIYDAKAYNVSICDNTPLPTATKLSRKIMGDYVIQHTNGSVDTGLTSADLQHDHFVNVESLAELVNEYGYPIDINGLTIYDTPTFNNLRKNNNLIRPIPKKSGFFKRLFRLS